MSECTSAVHPGIILANKLQEIGISALELAKRIRVPNNRLYAIIDSRRGVTADTALRLGQFFGTGPDYWLHLQTSYELDEARQRLGDSLDEIEPFTAKPAPPRARQTTLL